MTYNANIDSRYQKLIPRYLENRSKDILNMKQYLIENKYEEIHQIGHELKGSGGMYGFDEISIIGKEIEDISLLKDKEKIEININKLENYLSNLNIVYIWVYNYGG